jgi:hypothetical protein
MSYRLSAVGCRLSAVGLLVVLLGGCVAAPPAPPPTILPAPTLASGAPTAAVQTAPVVIGELTPYRHPSGVVNMLVPGGWEMRDASRPDELALAWVDPTRNGGLLLSVFEDPNPYTEEQLGAVLRGFLTRSYADLPDFYADEPLIRADGVVLMAWRYTAVTANGRVPLVGTSVISQRGNKIAILSLLLPAAQTAALAEPMETILAGYSLNPEALLTP